MKMELTPSTIMLRLSQDPYNNGILGEIHDPNTRTIIWGGPLETVLYWLEKEGYAHLRHSRGIWEKLY